MKQLSHNGVLVPKYEAKGFRILFRGKEIFLTPEQEEMAVAWVKKLGTDYVKEKVFLRNFFDDFAKALGIEEKISPEDIDFSEIISSVEKEKNYRLNLSKEERKRLAEERKKIRERYKEKYGYATVDGQRVEVSNYVVEPGSIFMGRGKHPLRGRWKKGVKESEIILNLSPDSKVPEGNWKEIVWEPDSMWIAKWDDKLRGKKKYVWLSDSSKIKQEREIEKFEKAKELARELEKVLNHILDNLDSEDLKRRKTATVSYLIYKLSMRVGDEKEDDEADTVGATTLTKDNVFIGKNNLVSFDFLGKDSVRWKKEVFLPEQVVKNLKEFIANSKSAIFNGVRSESVNLFLSEALPGLTSKVFRTYNASKAVGDYLKNVEINREASEDLKKYFATMANLQAAMVCNHKRTLPKNWRGRLQRKLESLKLLKERIKARRNKKLETLESRIKKLESMRLTRARKFKLREYKNKLKALRKAEMTEREKESVRRLELKINLMKKTKDYNLSTSLKSYIDPRVYREWFEKIDFDWKKYYPKALRRKFSWLEEKA
ncbi:MAG: DNA topoisomerase I [Candidatus Bathyarchaeia archaeon]